MVRDQAGQPVLGKFFDGFNWVFDMAIKGYGTIVGVLLRTCVIALVVYGGLMFLTYLGFRAAPTGFIPEQDKGYLVVNAQLPEGASLERSDAADSQTQRGGPQNGGRRAYD